MTFTYFKKTGEYKDKDGNWDGDEGEEFEYEVDEDEILQALTEIVVSYYQFKEFDWKNNNMKNLKRFINDFVDIDDLKTEFEDDLKDYFEIDAMDLINDKK